MYALAMGENQGKNVNSRVVLSQTSDKCDITDTQQTTTTLCWLAGAVRDDAWVPRGGKHGCHCFGIIAKSVVRGNCD